MTLINAIIVSNLTKKDGNGGEGTARSGAHPLGLLVTPLGAAVLCALEGGAKSQKDLRCQAGFPTQTTLRVQRKRLGPLGAIEAHRLQAFSGGIEYELTAGGRGLLFVVEGVDRWLQRAPDGRSASAPQRQRGLSVRWPKAGPR